MPAGWQEIDAPDGVTLSVPANWRPIDASDAVLLPEPCDSQLAEGRYVFGVAAGLAALTCPAEGPSFGPLVAGVRVGPTVELRDTRAAWDELVDVGGRWETVRVGFGVDQQVSLAILGSIRSTKPVLEPTPLRYRAYGGVIDASGAPPMLVFSQLDSLPPQVGSGIRLAGFSWAHIDGERARDGGTWTEESIAVIGEWDGTTFTLTQPAREADEPPGPTHGELTPDCDPTEWVRMLDAVDTAELGIIGTSDDQWDGRCGVAVDAIVDTPQLWAALEPFGDHVIVTFELEPVA